MIPYRYHDPQPQLPSPKPQRQRGRGALIALFAALVPLSAIGGGVAGAAWTLSRMPAPRTVEAANPAIVYVQPTVASPQVAPTAMPLPPSPAASVLNAASAVYANASASVVEIGVRTRRGSGGGSGFVVDSDGLIVTNYHVIEGARSVAVRFKQGDRRDAEVVAVDEGNDLAVLKVDLPAGVPVASLADSDSIVVGETAIAIGSPFGFEQTITQGIVSATKRSFDIGYGQSQRELIQTDAPINPGNSGGPLFNAESEVIGINTLNQSPIRGSVGVGFAVPINIAKTLIDQAKA
jgi:S1-C subfamily serine protease